MLNNYYRIIIILGLLIICGCSGVQNPASLPNPTGLISDSNHPLKIMADAVDSQGNPIGGSGILGLFTGQIDLKNKTAELMPLRSVSLDDTLEMVDITNFLQLAPCNDCVKLFNIEIDPDGHIGLNIGIKHPFDAGDPLKPISGRNRADLHVFNVEGTVIFDDSSGSTPFPGFGVASGPVVLINADGYSTYLDPAIDDIFPTNADMHPYILHFDDYSEGNFSASDPMGFESVTIPPPSGNLVMAMGCDYDIKQYLFNPPAGESVNFLFAVGCTYAVSASSKILRFNPEYQVPQHNKKAASEVHVEITNNQLASGDTGSSCELTIKVLDISHGVAVGDSLDQMKSDSSVGGIQVEVAGVTSGVISGSSTPLGGDGRDPLNPLTFSITFNNDQEAAEGMYIGVVKVTDTYPSGTNESPLLNGMDAIKRVDPVSNPLTGLYSLDEFATYAAFDVEITEASHAPVASFYTDPAGDPNLEFDFLDYRYITFTSDSTDPDDPLTPEGQIVLYEWDFVWDGNPANFLDDTAGMGTGQETWEVDRGGTWFTGLRVTDGGTPPLSSEIFSIQFTVGAWSDDFSISVDTGRVPKIAEMPSGDLMCIWTTSTAQTQYAIFDGAFTNPADAWSTPGVLSYSAPAYLSIDTGPGQNEAWASGSIVQYHYDGMGWSPTGGTGIISDNRMCHIYSNADGSYGVFNNTSMSFGFVTRIHWPDLTSYWYTFLEYVWLYGYNNRVLGESRIFDQNSSGKYFLVYMQDFAIDPYVPPQDSRFVLCAVLNEGASGYTHSIIDSGANDTLDSVVVACDTNDKVNTVYQSQPNGGGQYSIYYKSSTDNASSWGSQSTIYTGADAPEGEYISIDTDEDNNILVTYRVGNNIYWTSSADGSSWSTPEIVNTTWPGGSTQDKEQFMVVDSRGWTHVVWDRCASGAVGFGPIMHKVRAPIN
jgi:hypothetical protein